MGVALRKAEKVAVIGDEVKRRAPVSILAIAAIASLTGAVLLRRQRQQRAAPDGSGPAEGPESEHPPGDQDNGLRTRLAHAADPAAHHRARSHESG